MPIAVVEDANRFYVHVDHLNTPRLVANSSSTAVWRWDQQEPFGVNVPDENPSSLGAFELPLRLPGQYADKEMNLFYNYFRDYDSATARFLESDPIGLNGGLNTYAYVGGDPLTHADPQGLQFTNNAQVNPPWKQANNLRAGTGLNSVPKAIPILQPGPLGRLPGQPGYIPPLQPGTGSCYLDCFATYAPGCYAAGAGLGLAVSSLTGVGGLPIFAVSSVTSSSCNLSFVNTYCKQKCAASTPNLSCPLPPLDPNAQPGDVMMYY